MSTSFKQNQNYFRGSPYLYPQLCWTRCCLHKQQCPVHEEITSPSLPHSLSLTCLSALMSGHGSTAGGLKLLLLFHILYVCLYIQYLCVRKLHVWSWMAVPWTRCPGRTVFHVGVGAWGLLPYIPALALLILLSPASPHVARQIKAVWLQA